MKDRSTVGGPRGLRAALVAPKNTFESHLRIRGANLSELVVQYDLVTK